MEPNVSSECPWRMSPMALYHMSLKCTRCKAMLFLDSQQACYVCKSCGLVSRILPLPTLDNVTYNDRSQLTTAGDIDGEAVEWELPAADEHSIHSKSKNEKSLKKHRAQYASQCVEDQLLRIEPFKHQSLAFISRMAKHVEIVIDKCVAASSVCRFNIPSDPMVLSIACIAMVVARDERYKGIQESVVLDSVDYSLRRKASLFIATIDRHRVLDDVVPAAVVPGKSQNRWVDMCDRIMNGASLPVRTKPDVLGLLQVVLKEVWFFGRPPKIAIAAVLIHTILNKCKLVNQRAEITQEHKDEVKLLVTSQLGVAEQTIANIQSHMITCHGC